MSQKDTQLMVEENNVLATRIGELQAFFNSEASKAIKPLEFDLLLAQSNAMLTYHTILSIRLKLSQSSPDVAKAVTLVS